MALDYPSDLDGKSLKTTQVVTGHGKIKLLLTGKLPLTWLVLTAAEGTMQAAEGECHQQSYQCEPCELQ